MITDQEYAEARRRLRGGSFIYMGLTVNGLHWQRIVALRNRKGDVQGLLLNTGKWVEITQLRESK